MSNYHAAYEYWNERLKTDGWRSARDPVPCQRCGDDRQTDVTTIHGRTTFYCNTCGHHWEYRPAVERVGAGIEIPR